MTEAIAPVVLRIWRQGFMQWSAELWTPAKPTDPPPPDLSISRWDCPPNVPGYRRRDLTLSMTRRGARRAARKLREQHDAGPPPRPQAEYLDL